MRSLEASPFLFLIWITSVSAFHHLTTGGRLTARLKSSGVSSAAEALASGTVGKLDLDASPDTANADDDDERFDWRWQWYPVGVLDQMDRSRPHAVVVRGRELVLWFDSGKGSSSSSSSSGSGSSGSGVSSSVGAGWRAFEDRCPHRAAPLSEGRVESSTGKLFCACK